jgi:hypothetical protein
MLFKILKIEINFLHVHIILILTRVSRKKNAIVCDLQETDKISE